MNNNIETKKKASGDREQIYKEIIAEKKEKIKENLMRLGGYGMPWLYITFSSLIVSVAVVAYIVGNSPNVFINAFSIYPSWTAFVIGTFAIIGFFVWFCLGLLTFEAFLKAYDIEREKGEIKGKRKFWWW